MPILSALALIHGLIMFSLLCGGCGTLASKSIQSRSLLQLSQLSQLCSITPAQLPNITMGYSALVAASQSISDVNTFDVRKCLAWQCELLQLVKPALGPVTPVPLSHGQKIFEACKDLVTQTFANRSYITNRDNVTTYVKADRLCNGGSWTPTQADLQQTPSCTPLLSWESVATLTTAGWAGLQALLAISALVIMAAIG